MRSTLIRIADEVTPVPPLLTRAERNNVRGLLDQIMQKAHKAPVCNEPWEDVRRFGCRCGAIQRHGE